VGLCSDGEGEFGEGCRELSFRVGIDAEFVVAAPEIPDERVAGADHAGRAESFQSAHGSYSGFEPSMIGFDGIVCVLLHDMARGGQHLLEHSLVGRCPICGHLAGAYAVLEGAGKEPAGGRQIPSTQQRRLQCPSGQPAASGRSRRASGSRPMR
jgi:hypothetical protein